MEDADIDGELVKFWVAVGGQRVGSEIWGWWVRSWPVLVLGMREDATIVEQRYDETGLEYG